LTGSLLNLPCGTQTDVAQLNFICDTIGRLLESDLTNAHRLMGSDVDMS
jgi:hypothetical protein